MYLIHKIVVSTQTQQHNLYISPFIYMSLIEHRSHLEKHNTPDLGEKKSVCTRVDALIMECGAARCFSLWTTLISLSYTEVLNLWGTGQAMSADVSIKNCCDISGPIALEAMGQGMQFSGSGMSFLCALQPFPIYSQERKGNGHISCEVWFLAYSFDGRVEYRKF